MRYKINRIEIRSENAAKPISQPSTALIEWIGELDKVHEALDYGCGKLRYVKYLAKKAQRITLVDSEIQLTRMQRIAGKETSVRAYVKKRWPKMRVLSVEQFDGDYTKYDFILCANVLSAIPLEDARSAVFHRLYGVLKPKGYLLFTTQYENSYFKMIAQSSAAMLHLDGWILQGRRGASFYGVLKKDRLIKLVEQHGFSVYKAWNMGQSAYVLVCRGT